MVNSTSEAAGHINNFFYNFYKYHVDKYPTMKTAPVHFFGESYAGHYIPAYAYTLASNKTVPNMNLAGVGIGDGLFGS